MVKSASTDFSYLKALDVTKEKTVEFPLHQIMVNGKSPVLIVGPATEANKPYFNALLKRASKSAKALRSGMLNANMLEESREEDKELYPKYVIKGWRDMVDGAGNDSEFHRENCDLFIQALPSWLFDDLRTFCGNPGTFVDMVDIETQSGNSPSGSSSS